MKRSGIKPRSTKRQAELPDYRAAVSQAWVAADGLCVVKAKGCQVGARDPHHLRCGLGRPLLPGPTQRIIAACRSCHDLIHASPAWAREKGWLQ